MKFLKLQTYPTFADLYTAFVECQQKIEYMSGGNTALKNRLFIELQNEFEKVVQSN
jgi:hypothetical protein